MSINDKNQSSEKLIRIRLEDKLANLYDLGYLLVDLHQFLLITYLLENEKTSETAMNLLMPNGYYGLNRYSPTLREPEFQTEIVDIRKGSLELIVIAIGTTVGGITTSVAATLLSNQIKTKLDQKSQRIQLEFSPEDSRLSDIIAAFERNDFGRGDNGINRLIRVLSKSGYNTKALSDNSYAIEHAVEKYAKRIVKTIKKY